MKRLLLAVLLLAALAPSALPAAAQTLLDDFEQLTAWSPRPSDGVSLQIAPDEGHRGRGMRLDVDFQGHAGYAIARRAVDLDLPANFQFTFSIRGQIPVNNLELKLIDASGENVWWLNRRDFIFPKDWTEVATKKRQISFAWGPLGGGEPHHIAAIELVVTASKGGKGSVWIDDLAIEPLPPTPTAPVTFHPAGAPAVIDFEQIRELGGLTIDWRLPPEAFRIEVSRDGEHFRTLREVRHNRRKHTAVWLPEAEAHILRISGGQVSEVTVQPPSWAPAINDFFAVMAREAPRGHYPRYLIGEQPYWTVIGADGADHEALIGEDGNVEPFKGGFSIEPFVEVGGKLVTWADVISRQSVAEGDLPIPTVTWAAEGITLTMTAAVSDSSRLLLRYRLRGAQKATLYLTLRPFQVNPSTQFLNATGGAAPIRTIARRGGHLLVNGNQRVDLATTPARFVAATWDEGNIVDLIHADRRSRTIDDPFGYASAALVYPNAREVTLTVPMQDHARPEPDVAAAMRHIAAGWREKLHRVALDLPGAPQVAETVRTNLAYILIHRDGAALQPGSRSYERAWIRDGALMGAVLLRLGHVAEAKAFAEWFAGYQYPNGKVPCCVDHRGADPVPENDSHGELIFLVAEIWRQTHDWALVQRLWPHVDGAARYIDELRRQNHGPFEGLVTESISHEGYSAKPMHSYWDDVFCLRGIEDAATLARVVGEEARAHDLDLQAISFRHDLRASIDRTIAEHHLDYVPASAELGDFDPTSTAISISPLGLAAFLPQRELQRTYELYFNRLAVPRPDYTPYEMRIIGALIRLGDRKRALQLVDLFLLDRRPAAWNEWAEVVSTTIRRPTFLGDMPHAWVASDFIRSILDALCHEREDGALVVGAGIPRRWIGHGTLHAGPLATSTGTVDLRMRVLPSGAIAVDLTGTAHPGTIIVRSPDDRAIRNVTIDGQRVSHTDTEVVVPRLPARVVFEH
jgi:hypothetical protein